ncbi:3-hydroxyacyl-CoA dehydrogenase NAD-binding domain-containing protein [Aquirhabdus parva]|uniref:Hydroxylacyl-CoA dehydrogenase n=1 Tax=Aquirhabdus parva TaxID=2283318 RepID=A0A345P6S3_9GAMM|nr:3-hydroxyacyl-CoA dehydrogenase NAD-binding domain-containing protein [Aquirhabdus parva]AXI02982.1 hydroxylacyl-CoA dehydrogenase [Aquirhabdus parva]
MDEQTASLIESHIAMQNVTVIGAGVIGISWIALFLARGLRVVVYDNAPNIEQRVISSIQAILPNIETVELPVSSLLKRLSFETDLARAVMSADVIQENGPDKINFKRKLWIEIERYAPQHALFLSSSSGIPTRIQASGMQRPGRLLIGHPFNPPHLIPLVEVVPHKRALPETTQRALSFYRMIGKQPILLRKEVPGFVANRLQAALMREALLLVKWDVVTVDELDEIVTRSLGLRWATGGPFVSFHMGGGPKGFTGFIDHFSWGMQLLWLQSKFSPVFFSTELKEKLLNQISASFGKKSLTELEADRDRCIIALQRTLDKVK